jgi:hypothetical protein
MPRKVQKQSSMPPMKQSSLPPQSIEISRPTMFQSVKEGFGFGIGSSIAHNIFRSSPTQSQERKDLPAQVQEYKSVTNLPKEYVQCMKDFENKDACAYLLEEK